MFVPDALGESPLAAPGPAETAPLPSPSARGRRLDPSPRPRPGPSHQGAVEPAASERPGLGELRVLALGAALGLACPADRDGGAPLAPAERTARLDGLLALWRAGCHRLVDETLWRDLAARHPQLARHLRRRLRRR